jgi:hypothetical protein
MIITKLAYQNIKNKNLFKILEKKKVIIVNNCFTKNKMLKARKEIKDFFEKKKFRFKELKNKKKLFHRWDYNPKKARFKRIMCSATFSIKDKKYFQNSIEILKKGIALKKIYMQKFLKEIKVKKKSKFIFDPRASYYPSGGGYYQMHSDYFSGEKILDIIPLSEKGSDFLKGGFVIEYKKKKINLEQYVSPGSIILLHTKIKHGVSKIDPHMKLKKKIIGRYSLLSVMK